MTQAMPIISRPCSSEIEVNYYNVADSPIDRILEKKVGINTKKIMCVKSVKIKKIGRELTCVSLKDL